MLKKSCILLSFVVLSACGPSSAPPPDQTAPAAPPAGAAPAAAAAPAAEAPAAEPAPASGTAVAAPPAGPSAADLELARIKAEQRKLARQQAALAAQQQQAMYPPPPPPPPACMDCGVISSVVPVTQQGQAGLAGTLGGAAAGGLVGNQFGKGKGNTAMTVVGVLGGALAGRAVEQQVTSTTVYQIAVNMDAGGQRIITLPSANGIGPGMRVHVYGNNLQPY